MKKIKSRQRRKYEDDLWRDLTNVSVVKSELMKQFGYPARYAKRCAKQLLKDGIQYWQYEDVY